MHGSRPSQSKYELMKMFNIKDEVFHKMGEEKLTLDMLYILEKLYYNEPISEEGKTPALLQTLDRKGLTDSLKNITTFGKQMYESIQVGTVKKTRLAISVEGLSGIHKTLEDKILELTKKKQVYPEIIMYGKPKKYTFLCNERDLVNRLGKVITRYSLKDFKLIEKTLLGHIESCFRSKHWFPLMQYYITKTTDGIETSQLVTDMGNVVENTPKRKIGVIDI